MISKWKLQEIQCWCQNCLCRVRLVRVCASLSNNLSCRVVEIEKSRKTWNKGWNWSEYIPVPQQPASHKSIGPTYFSIIIIIGFYQQVMHWLVWQNYDESDLLFENISKVPPLKRMWLLCRGGGAKWTRSCPSWSFSTAQLSGRGLKYWLSGKVPSLKQTSGHNILTMILILSGRGVGNDNDDKIEDL